VEIVLEISIIVLYALIQEENSLMIVIVSMAIMILDLVHVESALKNVILVIMVQIVLLATPTQDDYLLQIVPV
jgi:hypothetical protein